MSRRALPIILLAISSPAWGQTILGVEAEGKQEQRLQLLDGDVSVSIESSGSVSLGRGEPSAGGGLGLSINDREIATVGQPDGETDAEVPSAAAGSDSAEVSDDVTAAEDEATTSVAAAEASGSGDHDLQCVFTAPDTQTINHALERGAEIIVRSSSCRAEPAAAIFIRDTPRLRTALSANSIATERLVAITFDDVSVTVHLASGS